MSQSKTETETEPVPVSGGKEFLWRAFRLEGNDAARMELADHYLPLARRIAASLFVRRIGNELEFADYMQYASVGLLEALEKYDPDLGAAFETYATYRIRGAVLNGIEQGSERLAQNEYRKQLRKERIDSLGNDAHSLEEPELFQMLVDVTVGLALGYMLEDSGLTGTAEKCVPDPYESYEIRRITENLRVVVEALPDRERMIIRQHYFESISFNVIAKLLGISKGRVSQIHARALLLIRDAYGGLGNLDVRG